MEIEQTEPPWLKILLSAPIPPPAGGGGGGGGVVMYDHREVESYFHYVITNTIWGTWNALPRYSMEGGVHGTWDLFTT